jgi:hypothetical protein
VDICMSDGLNGTYGGVDELFNERECRIDYYGFFAELLVEDR